MKLKNQQLSFSDVNDEYKRFVDKFKPKKTTDDCYTPDNVYNAVLDWVVHEYGIDRSKVVRPFWPGGDYERYDYPEGCTVVDNPPFSIISKICRDYQENGIKFFLFAPYLTNFSCQTRGTTHIITDIDVLYENGATVNTAFLTNLDEYEIRTAPSLREVIFKADRKNRRDAKRELPKYSYPAEVVTATMIGYLSKYGIDFRLKPDECHFIRQLESQKPSGKTLFGSGYLISHKAAAEKAAAEKAAAHVWELSDSERQIIDRLGSNSEYWSFNPYQE